MVGKNPRIQDVARLAGVSTATVSRAISNPDMLSEKTRKAVSDAIREVGYRVNPMARNLRKQRAGAILVLVPNLGNPFFSQILAGISEVLAGSEYSTIITDTSERREKGKLLDFFQDAQFDGVISLDGGLSDAEMALFDTGLAQSRLVFACEWRDEAPHPSIRSDNLEGARQAIRLLYDLGHRDIAHVTGPEGNVLTSVRREGMLEERTRLGLSTASDWIMRGDFSLQSGYAAAQRIHGMRHRPTAVFCASDQVAFGLISGLMERGISVPGDMSVVGFDDIEQAEFFIPALTTIRQNRPELGRRAAHRVLEVLKGPAKPSHHVETLDVALIQRASTAARQ